MAKPLRVLVPRYVRIAGERVLAGFREVTLRELQAEEHERQDRADLALGRRIREQQGRRARANVQRHRGPRDVRNAALVKAARSFMDGGNSLAEAIRYLRHSKRTALSPSQLRRILQPLSTRRSRARTSTTRK
jgi:hypothetical protein